MEAPHLTPPLTAIYPALLADFLARYELTQNARPTRSEWTYMCGVINLYHRIGVRVARPEAQRHYTIANISVHQSRMGEGIFTEMLTHAEAFCEQNDMALVVECVHNPRLYDFLVRRGYEPDRLYEQNLVRTSAPA